jgi:dipeptidyl aminopeptidase/acylaminoacyl peptidase
MRRALLPLLVALVSCRTSSDPKPNPSTSQAQPTAQRAPQAPVPLEEYFKIRRVGNLRFSHDETLVAYTSDEGGRPDIWVQPIDGGPATQVTHVKGFVHSLAFSPKSDRLLYEADTGGDELPHLYLTDSTGQNARDIAEHYPAGRRTSFIEWADDGKTFVYLSNLRDPQYMDLYEYNTASGKSEVLWKASGRLSLTLASRDHKRFVVQETISDADSNLYLLQRSKPSAILLTKHSGEVLYDAKAFSKNAATLYYTSDEGSEFTSLYAMDLKTKHSTPVLKAEWDVEDAGVSRTWKYFWTVTNVDGTPKLALSETATQKPVILPDAPGGGGWSPGVFSNSDRYLAAVLHSDNAPAQLYIVDLKTNSARKVTETLPESLRARAMVSGQSVRIRSFDAKSVPAFLYRPPGSGSFPAVIDVHGGPTGQSRRDFNRFRQYLVSKGYAVLVPNVRGSTGYGKTYTALDNLDLGGGPLQDVVQCKKWMVAEANVAADKVVVLGGSYGGYMALAAASFTPTEFAASVDYFGVSDLKTLVESFPPYWAAFATFIYKKFGDPKNPEHAKYQHDRSPINYVDQIQRPLLVVQGDRDARVKKDQSDRIVDALRKRNVPVHYLVLTDEGHGFSKNENYLQAFQVTDRFLDRYIFGDSSVDVLPPPKG